MAVGVGIGHLNDGAVSRDWACEDSPIPAVKGISDFECIAASGDGEQFNVKSIGFHCQALYQGRAEGGCHFNRCRAPVV